MKYLAFLRLTSSLALILLFITACGGGGGGGGSPGYSLSTGSVSVSANQDGSRPGSVDVTVTAKNGTLYFKVSGSSNASLSCSGGSSCNLSIGFTDPSSLAPGVYNSTVDVIACSDLFCSNPISSSPKSINISYTVQAGTSISSSTLNFTAVEGEVPTAQTIDIAYGGGAASWDTTIFYTGGTNWLSVTPGTGAGFPATLTVAPAAVSSGNYSANLQIRNLLTQRTRLVSVNYTVNPLLVSNPTSLAFSVDETSIASDYQRTVTTQVNAAASFTGVIDWQATTSDPWLSITPSTGDTNSANQFTVSLDKAKLAALGNGSHSGSITLSSTTANASDITIPVSLNLALPIANFVSPYVRRPAQAGTVTVRGKNFNSASITDVKLGTISASAFTVTNSTEISVTLPASLSAGIYPVNIVNSTGVTLTRANLYVITPTAFTESVIVSSGSKDKIIYEPRRNALYILKKATSTLEKHSYSAGSGWSMISTTITGLYDMDFSPDAEQLLVTGGTLIRKLNPDDLSQTSQLVPDSTLGTDTNFEKPRAISIGNDGVAAIAMRFNGTNEAIRPHKYDILTDTFNLPVNVSAAVWYGEYAIGHGLDRNLSVFNLLTSRDTIRYYTASNGNFSTGSRSESGPVSVSKSGTRILLNKTGYFSGNIILIGNLDDGGAGTTLASTISHNGSVAYTYDSAGTIRKFDLAGCSPFTCNEIGSGTVVANAPGNNPTMILSSDGGTLFIAGDNQVVVVPAP